MPPCHGYVRLMAVSAGWFRPLILQRVWTLVFACNRPSVIRRFAGHPYRFYPWLENRIPYKLSSLLVKGNKPEREVIIFVIWLDPIMAVILNDKIP